LELLESQARSIINRHMWLAVGIGLIPIPVLDMAALIALQLRMLRQLSENYRVPFYRGLVKKLVSALVGGIIPTSLAAIMGGGIRLVPVLGPMLGVMSMPLFSGATTLAVGKIFMQHFESGGTFLDFQPAQVRAYFRQEFEASQARAQEMWEMRQQAATRPSNGAGMGGPHRSTDR
jgi:uncharacterized protein (DUF697 family)